MDNKTTEQDLPFDLTEALADMDRSYEQIAAELPSLESDLEFILLGLRVEVVEQVEQALTEEGINRAELARRMEVSRARVSAILNESVNFKMETIAKLSVALNRDIVLRLIRKSEKVTVEVAQVLAETHCAMTPQRSAQVVELEFPETSSGSLTGDQIRPFKTSVVDRIEIRTLHMQL
jgi:transcriptional regulator with XRE-family HTH domain